MEQKTWDPFEQKVSQAVPKDTFLQSLTTYHYGWNSAIWLTQIVHLGKEILNDSPLHSNERYDYLQGRDLYDILPCFREGQIDHIIQGFVINLEKSTIQ